MNLLTICVLSGALATSFLARPTSPAPVAATLPDVQEAEHGAKKFEDPTWSRVVRIACVPGKVDAAIEIIQNHFRPAMVACGGAQPLALRHATGHDDLTAIWELPEGTASLDWELSPETVAWRAALAEQLGGTEKAQALMETYRSYVQEKDIELVRMLDLNPGGPVEASSRR